MLLSDLTTSQHAESWACFALFAGALPLLLIWSVGRPEANTRAAWSSLQGLMPLEQHLSHLLQLFMIAATVSLAVLMTLYTSSAHLNRWLKCQCPSLQLGD